MEKVRELKRAAWLGKHGDWGKWLVLRLARRHTGMTLSELGAELDNMDYAAVSIGLRRFEKRLRTHSSVASLGARACSLLNV